MLEDLNMNICSTGEPLLSNMQVMTESSLEKHKTAEY